MQRAGNAFAALALDSDASGSDDGDRAASKPSPPPPPPPDDDEWLPASAPRPKATSGDDTTALHPPLKRPLIWLDLEMTGLDPAVDTILEIALAATDGDVTRIVDGPSLTIAASDATLATMNAWCVREHGASGLTEACRASSTSLADAEEAALSFITKCVRDGDTVTLAGSSIHVDYAFLRVHMPRLTAAVSHRLVDVSSVGVLARRWHPSVFYARPAQPRGERHRAAADVRASIAELQHYKKFMVRGVREAARDVARECPNRGKQQRG